jgi:hypothetical protein
VALKSHVMFSAVPPTVNGRITTEYFAAFGHK